MSAGHLYIYKAVCEDPASRTIPYYRVRKKKLRGFTTETAKHFKKIIVLTILKRGVQLTRQKNKTLTVEAV